MRIVFFGSPEFAVPSLAAVASAHHVVAVVTQPDRPAGRGAKLQPPAIKVLAAELGLPVLQPLKLRDGVVASELGQLAPDLFVVVAYGRILPPDLLVVPRLGPWNVHASLLPKYRGAAPIQWAIVRGEHETGVSIMRMEAGLDTGPVAAQVREPIGPYDTAGMLAPRLASLGAKLLLATLPSISDGSVVLREQDHAAATLAPPLEKADGRLDFAQPAAAVSAHARGMDPWPGASVMLDGESVKVFAPRIVAGSAEPGRVLGVTPEGLVVACRDRAVAFGELQFPGRKRMPAKALVAGHPIPPGARLS